MSVEWIKKEKNFKYLKYSKEMKGHDLSKQRKKFPTERHVNYKV